MPETNESNASYQEGGDSSNPPLIPNEKDTQNNVRQQPKTEKQTKDEKQRVKWRRPVINVNIPEQDDTAMLSETKRGNAIALWSAIFSALAAIGTVAALIFVKASTDAAVAAANEAKRSNDHIFYKDSIDRIQDSIDDSYQYYKDSVAFGFTNKSIQAQLKSLDISASSVTIAQQSFLREKKAFEITNSSYILIDSVGYNQIKPLTKNVVHIRIKNFGKVPARLQSYNAGVALGLAPKTYEYRAASVPITWYMTADDYTDIPVTLPMLSHYDFDRFAKEQDYMVLYGEVRYFDILTNKNKVFLFSFRVYPNRADYISMTEDHNEVVDAKN